jgi:hypothetical protein
MTLRTQALADAIEDELGHRLETVENHGTDVFVITDMHGTHHLDGVCAIAYDHGFVPCGITKSGAARFKPRDNDELDV